MLASEDCNRVEAGNCGRARQEALTTHELLQQLSLFSRHDGGIACASKEGAARQKRRDALNLNAEVEKSLRFFDAGARQGGEARRSIDPRWTPDQNNTRDSVDAQFSR